MKQIKVSDETHAKIQAMAKESYRNISAQVDFMTDVLYGGSKQVTQSVGGENTFISVRKESQELTPLPENPQVAEVAGLVKRSKGDILADIRDVEAERDEKIRYCQDDEEAGRIRARYESLLTVLWDEYKEAE